jgi:hypothetical protein
MNISFGEEATREQARARIGLQGPAGCGKTKSALRIAEGLAQGGTIGLVDTERRSALTYAIVPGQPHLGGHRFRHVPMDSYDPRNLIQAVEAAEAAGLAVLIVDSWSHFWNGRGGLLEIVDRAGSGAGGSFGGWKTGNPIEQDMLTALLNFSGHLIVTMRTKTDYVIDESGPKKKITKVGTKVVQREGTDYELGVIIDMIEGTGTVSKTRYEVLEGLSVHHPGEELAATILEQLGQGVDKLQSILDALAAKELTYEAAIDLHRQADRAGLLTSTVDHPQDVAVRLELGELIRQYGTALKGAAAPAAQATPQPPAASSTPTQQQGEPANAQSMRMMHALLNKAEITDRDDVLAYIGGVIGRQIESRKELTADEISKVIAHLQAAPALASA